MLTKIEDTLNITTNKLNILESTLNHSLTVTFDTHEIIHKPTCTW